MVQTLEVLEQIGFTGSGSGPYDWNFGNGEVSAVEGFGLRNGQAIYFDRHAAWDQTLITIETAMPLSVELFEVGLAWVAYICRGVKPRRPTPWLSEGLALQEHLPWVKRQKAFQARPQCSVPRDWFRLASRALREAAEAASDSHWAAFVLEGPALRIEFGATLLMLPAEGRAWPDRVQRQVA